MTETNATTSGAGPVFPAGRYGRRRAARRTPRWVPAVLLAAVVVAGLAVAVRLYQQYGTGAYDAQVIRFHDVADDGVTVEFTVEVPSGTAAVCVVRARAADGAEVGREQVRVTPPPGVTRPVVTHRLTTRARPVTGEVPRCWRDH